MAIFTHVCVGTNDLERANKFYTACLGKLGINNLGPLSPTATLYGVQSPEFLVGKPSNGLIDLRQRRHHRLRGAFA